MLVEKDLELDRIRQLLSNTTAPQKKQKSYRQPDSGSASIQEEKPTPTEPTKATTKALDAEYLKIILLKYLEFMASGEKLQEALTLEKVLFSMLEASPQDLALLKIEREKNNAGFWSYVYDLSYTQQVAEPVDTRRGK